MKRSGPPKRKKPLAKESARKRANRARRRAVSEQTRAAFGLCHLHPLGGCYGQMTTHEVVKRSQKRDVDLDPRFTITLCWGHNSWVEDNPRAAASYGVYIKSWAYDMDPEGTLAEAKLLRGRLWMEKGFAGQIPSWWTDVGVA